MLKSELFAPQPKEKVNALAAASNPSLSYPRGSEFKMLGTVDGCHRCTKGVFQALRGVAQGNCASYQINRPLA